MRVISIPKRKIIEWQDYSKRKPVASEMGELIDSDTIVYEGGRPVLFYTALPKDILADMREVVKTTKYTNTNRTRGLPTKSSTFGAMPRVALRCNYCRFTTYTRTERANFERILRFRNHIAQFYEKYFPENYSESMSEIQKLIHPDWFAGADPSLWLTCNINVNIAIPYHRDSGNMKTQFSNVIILRENVRGGELVCPEFGISLSQRDGALTIFDGQSIAHGVMPIYTKSPGAYRASIVFYTLQEMKHCLSLKGEVDRVKAAHTASERVSCGARREKIKKMKGRK